MDQNQSKIDQFNQNGHKISLFLINFVIFDWIQPALDELYFIIDVLNNIFVEMDRNQLKMDQNPLIFDIVF